MAEINTVILGGNGLIGRALAKELTPFLVLDSNITEDLDKNYFKSTADNVEEFCRIAGKKPDVIYLLTNSVKDFGDAVNTFITVCEYCKKIKAKLVYLSNTSVYNIFTIENMDEVAFTLEGEYFYSIDRIAKFFRRDIKIVGFRIFSLYGDNFGYPYLLTKTKKKIKTSKYKDLVNISSIIKILKMASKKGNGIYNLGTGYKTDISKLGNVECVGTSPIADTSMLEKDFGYLPEKYNTKKDEK